MAFSSPSGAHEGEGVPPDETRTRLEAGNARYAGSTVNPRHYRLARPKLAEGQAPYAMVLACADSRVPPEIVFDESLGKLFVVRLAGNVADVDALGSFEYAAEHLGIRYLLILGHASCAAVKAAVSGAEGSANLNGLVQQIKPAVEAARGALPKGAENQVTAASVRENVRLQMKNVSERSPILREMISKGTVGIAGGVYDLETGRVTFLPEKQAWAGGLTAVPGRRELGAAPGSGSSLPFPIRATASGRFGENAGVTPNETQPISPAPSSASSSTRREHDLLGERDVPSSALYGVQTLRAVENFPITGIPLSHYPLFVKALAMVKLAAARANLKLGVLEAPLADAICTASQEVIDGKWHEHFVVDMVQGGAGTSTNMNANEVIANRALELLGHARGEYTLCHPNNHVNLSQSTNDVYPTAIRVASILALRALVSALETLEHELDAKGSEFKRVLKMGRTQLQDAVPMTLGQEFHAFAVTTGEDIARLRETVRLFHEVNLGGTAIGTGINADPRYPRLAVAELRDVTGLDLVLAGNLVEATPDTGAFVMFSGVLKRTAVKLSKMCNDLRLLSSGPRCGFGEINLPPMQPGSSIMPGKVNPVIPEVVNQVAFQVIGNDLTITLAAEAGQLQLNVMEPILVFNLFQSVEMLTAAVTVLTERCIRGITANVERCLEMVEHSIAIVTAVVPVVGYEKASEVAKEALATGKPVREILLAKGYLTAAELDDLLSIEGMTKPRAMARKTT